MNRIIFLLLPLAVAGGVSTVQATVISHQVDARDALFFYDWGHPYTETWDGVTRESNERSGVGRGDPAEVVSNVTGAVDFARFGTVEISASGSNAINGDFAFGPDGVDNSPWRELRLYSLIGLWSGSDTGIDPIGVPFDVGSAITLDVPVGRSAYLWLGFNDGNYDDNDDAPLNGGDGYEVSIVGHEIPEPACASLLLVGVGLVLVRRRKRLVRVPQNAPPSRAKT